MGIIICRDNDKNILKDQILGSPVRNQFQKDAGSQSVNYSLPFDNQDQQIILYWYILYSVFLICLQKILGWKFAVSYWKYIQANFFLFYPPGEQTLGL